MTFIHFVTGKSSGILSHIFSGIRSGILSGISSGILPGISSGIFSGTLSGISSGIFSGILSGKSSGVLSGKHSGTLSSILSGMLSAMLSGVLSGISCGILSGRWGPAVLTELGRSQGLRSSRAHWARKVPGWGPAVLTELGRSQVEVQRCPLRSDPCSWGPAVATACGSWRRELGEELGEELARRKWTWKWGQRWWRRTRRRRRRRRTTLIKSNNPHWQVGNKFLTKGSAKNKMLKHMPGYLSEHLKLGAHVWMCWHWIWSLIHAKSLQNYISNPELYSGMTQKLASQTQRNLTQEAATPILRQTYPFSCLFFIGSNLLQGSPKILHSGCVPESCLLPKMIVAPQSFAQRVAHLLQRFHHIVFMFVQWFSFLFNPFPTSQASQHGPLVALVAGALLQSHGCCTPWLLVLWIWSWNSL